MSKAKKDEMLRQGLEANAIVEYMKDWSECKGLKAIEDWTRNDKELVLYLVDNSIKKIPMEDVMKAAVETGRYLTLKWNDEIDGYAPRVEIIEELNLDKMYEITKCRMIDIATREIGGRYFDIIVDDEGLLKTVPVPSMIFKDRKEGVVMDALYGNAIIANHDKEGNTIGLTREDARHINKFLDIRNFSTVNKPHFMAAQVIRKEFTHDIPHIKI